MLKVLLCNLIAFGFVPGAYGLTIPASEDTVGTMNKLTTGANAASNLMVDANHTAFLYFNLDDVPHDAVLRWAKLRLFLPTVRVKGAGLGVHVVSGSWDEASASNQPTMTSGTVASIGPEKLGTRRFVTVDVTSTVQSWISGGIVNEGFAIKPISGGSAVSSLYLTSKDGASLGLPAELDLDFKPEIEAPAAVSVEQLPSLIKTLLTPKITTPAGILSDVPSIGAVVEGLGPFTYQWYKDGVAVSGGTGSTLSLIGLTSGTYTLSASNGFATVGSGRVQYNGSISTLAIAQAETQSNENFTKMTANGVWWGLAQQDRPAALSWIESLPEGAFRMGVLSSVMMDSWLQSMNWGSDRTAIEAGAALLSKNSQLDYYASLMSDRRFGGMGSSPSEIIAMLPLSEGEKLELYRRIAPIKAP